VSTRIHAHQTAVLVAAFVVSACSGSPIAASQVPWLAATSPAPSSSAAPSPARSGTPATPAEVVLRVTTEGGFIGPAARLAQLPEVVVYADGRILTPAPAPAIYPGPLVPVESVRDVGAAGVAAIRAAITAAGLDAGGGTSPWHRRRRGRHGLRRSGWRPDRHDALSRPRRRIAAGRRSAGIVGRSAARGRGDAPVTARRHDGAVGRPGGAGRGIRPNGLSRLRRARRSDRIRHHDAGAARSVAAADPVGVLRQVGPAGSRDHRPACRGGHRSGCCEARPGAGCREPAHGLHVGRRVIHAVRQPVAPRRGRTLTGRAHEGSRDAAPRGRPGRGTLRLSDGAGAAEA